MLVLLFRFLFANGILLSWNQYVSGPPEPLMNVNFNSEVAGGTVQL